MPAYFPWLKYLILLVSFSSLRLQGQTPDSQDSLSSLVTKDSIRKTADSVFVPVKNSKEVDDLISFAKRFLGTPYRYAGTTPSGFDCSGFIMYVFGHFGLNLVRTSYGMAELGTSVKLSEIRPGDLMFFKGRDINSTKVGHVAMVVEVSPTAIKFIHASSSRGITIDNFKTSKYFIARFIKAKRLDWGEREK
jgi:cell wall-associated NlpC family hydrolase